MVKQLSVFVENKEAALSEVVNVLSESKTNLRALSIADTADFGILRLIAEDVDFAAAALKAAGFIVKVNTVLAIAVKDEAGALAGALKTLADAKISLEYAYAFTTVKAGEAGLIIRVDDNDTAKAALEAAGIKTVSQEELF